MSDSTGRDKNGAGELIVSRPAPAEVVPFSEFSAPLGASMGRSPNGMPSVVTMLLRRKWLVLVVAAITAALGVPAVWLFYWPAYRATGVLRISPTVTTIVFPDKNNQIPQYQLFVNTEVSVIRSPTVLQRVLESTDIQRTQWYKDNEGSKLSPSEMLDRLLQILTVEPRPGTELIDVSVMAPKPAEARLLADAVVNEYRKLKEDTDKQSGTFVKEQLTTQQSYLQQEIDGMIKTRFSIAAPLGTDAPGQLRSQMSQQVSLLEGQLHARQQEKELKEWKIGYLQKASSPPEASHDITTRPSAETLMQLRMEVEELKKEIELRQNELDKERAKLAQAGDAALEIVNLDEKIRQKRELYEALRARHEQLDIEDKAPARVRVVAMATEPTRPAANCRWPATAGILMGAGLLSLCLLAVRPRCAPGPATV